MHSRIAVPLLILLSACAQAPTSNEHTSTLGVAAPQSEITSAVASPVIEATAPQAAPTETPAPRVVANIRARSASQGQSTTTPAPTAAQLAELPLKGTAQPEAPPKSLWVRINKGYVLPPMENELVREWETWYSTRPDYVARMIHRSSHFLYHIVEQVEKRGMPMEIALLPMIESAYNPVAYSRSHASGMWQFIASTGKDFGLRQNWWYDGRRDVLAATDAALDYLEKLYGMFGDWNLALAAYNWGEGAVGRAMEKNRAKGLPTDYESLTVPAETRGYVPKLIAVKNIISNPARFGLQIADVPNEPYFATVTVKRHIDVKLAAKMADMPLDEFKFLNPGHNKPVIKAGEAQRIVLPKDRLAMFRANFDRHDKPLVSWKAVTLKRGEKAEKLAAAHGMTLAELKQINGLAHQKRLVSGQPLLVPLKTAVDDPHLPDLPVTPVTLPKAIQAAKANGQRQAQNSRGGKVLKASHTAGRKAPARKLRAEPARRVKVAVPVKPVKKPAAASAQRQKVAAAR